MAWSKVTGKKLPFKWWVHKLCCEWGWVVRHRDDYQTYYHHLNLLFQQGYNLYGEKINVRNENKNKDTFFEITKRVFEKTMSLNLKRVNNLDTKTDELSN